MLGKRKAPEAPPASSSAWTARYTAHLSGGKKLIWEEQIAFPSENKQGVALNLVAAQTKNGLVRDGVYYPLHRVLRITADIL